jgi:membrane protease YdiL (CAAX protease family)
MNHDQQPSWWKPLPFLALVPSAALQNGSLVSLLIVVLALVFVKASRAPTLAFAGGHWQRSILTGIFAGAALWFLSDRIWDPLLEQWLGRINVDNLDGVRGHPLNLAILLALAIIYGGVIEEVIFRGFMIGWGSRLLGHKWLIPLILLSSIVFGSAHRYQGLAGAVSAGLSGLVFAILYVASGRRLLVPALAHIVADVLGILEIYYGFNGS